MLLIYLFLIFWGGEGRRLGFRETGWGKLAKKIEKARWIILGFFIKMKNLGCQGKFSFALSRDQAQGQLTKGQSLACSPIRFCSCSQAAFLSCQLCRVSWVALTHSTSRSLFWGLIQTRVRVPSSSFKSSIKFSLPEASFLGKLGQAQS